MLYELRQYDARSARGLDAVIQRFADHTLRIWDRYGISPVGFWRVTIGSPAPRLTYMLGWEDLAQRQTRWDAFLADPEWQQIVTETNARTGGSPIHTITNSILAPTSFSPEPLSDLQPSRLFGGTFEFRSYACEDAAGLARLSAWFRDHGIPHLEKHHIHPLGFWTTIIGVAPRFTYMLVFENLSHRERAWASLLTDPSWSSLQDGLYHDGKPLIMGAETALMKGTTFSAWK